MRSAICGHKIIALPFFRCIRQGGFAMMFVIAAMAVVGGIAAGVVLMSSDATRTELAENRHLQAYYAAFSGQNFAKTLDEAGMIAINTAANSQKQFTINDATFTLVVGSKSGTTYPVKSIGTIASGTRNESNFMIGPVDIAPVQSGEVPDNPLVPPANFAGAMYNFAGTQFTGDTIFEDATFNGGVTVDGSISYVGSGSNCLVLDGNRIGKLDGSSVICSNTCITLRNINAVYGTVISQGDITVTRGVIYGNVYSGGNVKLAQWNGFIKKLAGAGGTLNLVGSVDYPGNVEGGVKHIASKPNKCQEYSLPDHELIKPASDLLNYSTQTFTGKAISDRSSNVFNNLSTNGGAKTCFDLSTAGTYINIFVAGDLNFNSSVYIKSPGDVGDCFVDANKITTSNYSSKKFIEAAKKIYMDVNGKSTFGGDGHAWVGTLFSKGNIKSQGSFVSVGALYSDGTIDTSGGSYAYYVKSDYANLNWK